jgi:hypothetical protein
MRITALEPQLTLWLLTLVAASATLTPSPARGGDLDTIGITLLRAVDPTLTGTGVNVAHPEASLSTDDFEVNPAAVGQPTTLFTWISGAGRASTFPNAVGTVSGHAGAVGANFYGSTAGAAPQLNHVDNYDALHFVNNVVATLTSMPGRVANQSFVFSPGDENVVNPLYDDYAALHGTLFSSGVGNGGNVLAPGSCYNGLGVGVYGISSAVGPTPDGRCKPDLVAPDMANYPSGANSYSIPYVSAAGAILIQAAFRGDGGNVPQATSLATLKALLLNGAVKPADWTNSAIHPLDLRYGAGNVNVFNSWNQLKGRRRTFIETTSNTAGGPHPPGTNQNNVAVLTGWDFNYLTNTLQAAAYQEQVNHYYFQLTGTNRYTLTTTLVWNRQQSQTSINDLNLFLYNAATSNLVASSTSTVDNVEHLFLNGLLPGRYDLQVLKRPAGQVTTNENYALAFEFFNLKLAVAKSNLNVVLSWPVAPAGFHLESTASLTSPSWVTVNSTAVVNNNQNYVTLPISPGSQYFRLARP